MPGIDELKDALPDESWLYITDQLHIRVLSKYNVLSNMS